MPPSPRPSAQLPSEQLKPVPKVSQGSPTRTRSDELAHKVCEVLLAEYPTEASRSGLNPDVRFALERYEYAKAIGR